MKNRILRSALSVALCAAMLLSQGLTAFAENEIVPSPNSEGNSAAAEFSLIEEKEGEPSVTDGKNVSETPASTENETEDAKLPVKIHVICEAELPSIDPSAPDSILEKIRVDMNCTKDDKHDTLKYTNLASVSPLDYSIEYNKDEGTATVSLCNLDEWVRLYEVQDKVKHTFTVSNPSTIGLKYNPENGWQLEDESKNTFVIEIACDAVPSITPEEIVDLLKEKEAKVNVVCTTDVEHTSSLFDITADSIRVGKWDDSDNSVPFYLSTESYVDEFNRTCPSHTLKKSNDKEIALWIFYGKDGWTVNFASLDVEVVCSGTPVEPTDTPEPPSMEEIMTLLWDKKVTANCTNADCKKKETYDIQYESIGGLLNPTIKPIEGEDGSYSLKLTIAYEPYKDDFEDKYGPHNFADNQTSTSEFYLKWDRIKWSLKDPDFFPGSFNVICDTPSTESLWGWNNGKEVIITCVEENALHTKGMTLSLVGVNGDKYWKFDPITWDQEQKCYTTTVTLEPGKYLEVYSGQYGEHALVSDHEDTVLSLKLSYQDGNGKWISNGDKFYLFVKCNAPSKPTIEDLDRLFTNNTKVNISCEKNKHADKWYPVKDNSVDRLGYLFIGPVEVDDNNHYTAKMTTPSLSICIIRKRVATTALLAKPISLCLTMDKNGSLMMKASLILM